MNTATEERSGQDRGKSSGTERLSIVAAAWAEHDASRPTLQTRRRHVDGRLAEAGFAPATEGELTMAAVWSV